MINLAAEDRKQLIAVLKDIPELATERGRRLILELAGLEKLAPYIDFSGSAFLAVIQIVQWLSNYGYVDENNQALGLFLNTIKELDGVQSEQREYLEKLLNKYGMMKPIPPSSKG
ncbi:MAG: hypothetical protein SXA11_14860 [Cyanobacteriota bacterium]|nr:hypothetical protein [Cyanobacteriota bacterium]